MTAELQVLADSDMDISEGTFIGSHMAVEDIFLIEAQSQLAYIVYRRIMEVSQKLAEDIRLSAALDLRDIAVFHRADDRLVDQVQKGMGNTSVNHQNSIGGSLHWS